MALSRSPSLSQPHSQRVVNTNMRTVRWIYGCVAAGSPNAKCDILDACLPSPSFWVNVVDRTASLCVWARNVCKHFHRIARFGVQMVVHDYECASRFFEQSVSCRTPHRRDGRQLDTRATETALPLLHRHRRHFSRRLSVGWMTKARENSLHILAAGKFLHINDLTRHPHIHVDTGVTNTRRIFRTSRFEI